MHSHQGAQLTRVHSAIGSRAGWSHGSDGPLAAPQPTNWVRLAIALSLIVGGAQLAYFLVYPSISQEGATDEWVFDLAYLVAVVLSLAGWAGVLVWSAVSLRPGSPTGPRLLPQMSLGAAVPSLGLLLGFFVLVVAISVGDDSAWLAWSSPRARRARFSWLLPTRCAKSLHSLRAEGLDLLTAGQVVWRRPPRRTEQRCPADLANAGLPGTIGAIGRPRPSVGRPAGCSRSRSRVNAVPSPSIWMPAARSLGSLSARRKQECQPPELGTLVLQTLGEGQAQRFGQWAEANEAGEPEPARPMTDPGYRTRVVKGSRGDFAVRDAIRKVGGLNGALDELIDSMKAVATAEHRGRSSSGHVTATANGRSEVVGIDFEVDWLDSAHSFNIGREATEAINDSVRRAASSTLDEVVADSRLGRLRQLLVEPAETRKAPPSNNNEGGTQA